MLVGDFFVIKDLLVSFAEETRFLAVDLSTGLSFSVSFRDVLPGSVVDAFLIPILESFLDPSEVADLLRVKFDFVSSIIIGVRLLSIAASPRYGAQTDDVISGCGLGASTS